MKHTKIARLTRMLLALCLLLSGCAENTPSGNTAEMWMLNVGKGDAIVIETQGKAFLIDAARPERWGVISQFLQSRGITRLDGVFLTHTDNDHAGGLELLVQSDIEVGAWYAPAFSLTESKKHPAHLAAAARGQSVTLLKAGDTAEGFSVLAPARLIEGKEDDNSLVLSLNTAGGRVLLTGDMEFPEEAELMAREKDLRSAVLKVANHGDDDTLSARFAWAVQPRIALISTDPYEKPGTPDDGLMERLRNAGAEIFRTDEGGMAIYVGLDESGARAGYVSWPETPPEPRGDVWLEAVDAEGDTFVVATSGAALDLAGWYVVSSRGGEALLLAEGTVLPAGGKLKVGSRSASGKTDVLWNDKNVIHNSKTDRLTLYDPWGRAAAWGDNGL